MAINFMQVTLGAGATQVTATATRVRQVTIQNNATHVCRLGDSTVTAAKGYSLQPSTVSYNGQVTWGDLGSYNIDLRQLYLFGTATDVIDVIWID
jgi:hypothetical protein